MRGKKAAIAERKDNPVRELVSGKVNFLNPFPSPLEMFRVYEYYFKEHLMHLSLGNEPV